MSALILPVGGLLGALAYWSLCAAVNIWFPRLRHTLRIWFPERSVRRG